MRREEKREEKHALAWMEDKERVIVELFRDGVVVLCWRLVALANLAPGALLSKAGVVRRRAFWRGSPEQPGDAGLVGSSSTDRPGNDKILKFTCNSQTKIRLYQNHIHHISRNARYHWQEEA
jgi:hypothetical protein